MFNLQEKINHLRAEKGLDTYDTDSDVESVINQPEQEELTPATEENS
jgi:hypothetical protein